MKYTTLLGIIAVLFLSGCSSAPVKLRTETVEVFRPILYCPAPNWDELGRPRLLVEKITPNMPAGEVAKHYKATVKQLEDYANRLERALQQYDSTNAAYEELRQQFLKERSMDGFTQ